MSKPKKKKETKAKKAVQIPEEFPLSVKRMEAFRDELHAIRLLEQVLDGAKKNCKKEEQLLIGLVQTEAKVEPGVPDYWIETLFRANVAWKEVFLDRHGKLEAFKVSDNWPKTKYEYFRFGKPKKVD